MKCPKCGNKAKASATRFIKYNHAQRRIRTSFLSTPGTVHKSRDTLLKQRSPPPLRAGGLGMFAFRDIPSRRFAPSFVCFEATTCIRWN